jgi:DNA-binding NarL/FixJ family response regulator
LKAEDAWVVLEIGETRLAVFRRARNDETGVDVGVDVARSTAAAAVRSAAEAKPALRAEPITPAELAVLRAIFEGKSNAAIAHERGTSPRTIANQVASIFRKHGVRSRGELVARYLATASPSIARSPSPSPPSSPSSRSPS